ncbi:MAG TPA: thiopurine S-methyltransferase [Kofleriaceae bacterium]
MNPAFWRDRWSEGKIGFHEGKPNEFLSRHGTWLESCRRILVPLCGKSEDLAYLAARGHEVVGVELVEDAVRQFFVEHAVPPEITARDGFAVYTAGSITVFAGDFFATTAALVGDVDGIFDRAALVALPPDMRGRYIDHVRAIAPNATRELLVSLEYPAGSMEGPPFSVDQAEVRERFAGDEITLVDEGLDPRGRADGKLLERCYTIAFARRG